MELFSSTCSSDGVCHDRRHDMHRLDGEVDDPSEEELGRRRIEEESERSTLGRLEPEGRESCTGVKPWKGDSDEERAGP